MILEEFDESRSAIINPENIHKPIANMPKTCVSFFSKSLMNLVLENYKPEIITNEISNATTVFPVYKITINGTDLAIFQSAVGAPACVSNAEELISLGVKNILTVGCCGCLTSDIEEYSIIIPTSAIRDEGTSYHYARPSNETTLNPDIVTAIEDILISHSINYKKGKTWTTDAIFRETKKKASDRIKQGAITVDMECSAMNILCQFRGVNYGQIFYGIDNLSGEEYDPRSLLETNSSSNNTDAKHKIIALSLECGLAIDKKF